MLLNGYFDTSPSKHYVTELISKQEIYGRGFVSRSLIVRDWRRNGKTAVLGSPAINKFFDSYLPGQKLRVTTRRGLFDAEWIKEVEKDEVNNK